MEFHIFDFDKTLFKSPEQPDWWVPEGSQKSWWLHNDSLARPCVPDKPDGSWWVSQIVSQAKKSVSNPKIITILATGRSDVGPNRYRIPELLKQAGIRFDGVHLNRTNNAHVHKAMITTKYLEKYGKTIDLIQMWDDGKENLAAVKRVAAKFNIEFKGHLVKAGTKKLLCTPETYQDKDPYKSDPATKLAKRWLNRVK